MNDGDDTNDYYVLSVRSEDHYNIGHVPGAANIPWREVADPAKLTILPTDQKIGVYCYTGHTGGVATTVLRALGYETYNMKWGIMSWTRVDSVRVAGPFNEADVLGAATETTVNTPGTYDLPDFDVSSSTDETTIILAAANAYLGSGDGATITAQTLFDNINDGDDTNDYYVISVRSASHYALGHIPGAINIPWRDITELESLHKIPPDATIAVYCYTGHTGAVATTALRMLGYEAYNMRFGLCAWTSDPTVRATSAFDDTVDSHEFPVEP
jgi:rhodanese-related sulfurtransferase